MVTSSRLWTRCFIAGSRGRGERRSTMTSDRGPHGIAIMVPSDRRCAVTNSASGNEVMSRPMKVASALERLGMAIGHGRVRHGRTVARATASGGRPCNVTRHAWKNPVSDQRRVLEARGSGHAASRPLAQHPRCSRAEEGRLGAAVIVGGTCVMNTARPRRQSKKQSTACFETTKNFDAIPETTPSPSALPQRRETHRNASETKTANRPD